jgi:hypothetical protein
MEYIDFLLSGPPEQRPTLLGVQRPDGQPVQLGHTFTNLDGTTTLRILYRYEDLPDAPKWELADKAQHWDLDNVKVLCRLIALSKKADIAELRGWVYNHFDQFGNRKPDTMKSWLEELPASKDAGEEQLWRALAGDDLTAILKGHLAIENLLEQLIVRYMPKAAVLFDESFMFARKVQVLRRLDAIPKPVATMLQSINEVRNDFGHKPGLLRFAPEHWQKVAKALPKDEIQFIEQMLKDNGILFVTTQTPATPMRIAIFLAYAAVQEALPELEK